MKPQEQLNVMSKIWGPRSRGYVFLPWIPAGMARTAQRKRSWQEGPAFAWPEDRPKIMSHLEKHRNDELYFTPMMFSGRARRVEAGITNDRLWADLDGVDPHTITEQLKPTYAWETSPGRFAAVWCMTSGRPEIAEPGMENHRLTHHIGADPSGWDGTQLLRVPGSANNKKEYPRGTRGRMVWEDRVRHTWNVIDGLPSVPVADVTPEVEVFNASLLDGIDRFDVWGRVRLAVSPVVREYMGMTDAGGLDRSEVAWQIERDLADAGCTLLEMVAIMQPTVWNKYDGRQDEIKRLITECTKALNTKSETDATILEVEDDQPKPVLIPFWLDDAYLNQPDPDWLIPDLVPVGGCGFISGVPKSLKSWLALDMAISLTANVEFLERKPTRPMNVLYIQQEDPATLVHDRHVTIAGTKAPNFAPGAYLRPSPGLLFIVVQSGFTASNPGWQAWLDEQVRDHDIDLVIMDTLATVAGDVDTDNAREVKTHILNPMKQIARAHSCAMLFVHHNTKAGSNARAGQNMAGSGQIHAWADWGIYVTEKIEANNRLTMAIETKYTGTTVVAYEIRGLPDAYEPTPVVSDRDMMEAGRVPMATGKTMHEQAHERRTNNITRVVQLRNQGYDDQQIKTDLGVSQRTLNGYLKEIRSTEWRK